MTIQISDVDKLETELEKIKEQHGQMVVQISGMDDRIHDIEQWKENHNPAPTSPFTDDNNPATPQPVRIRPEDMVMVKWSDEKEPRETQLSDVNMHYEHATLEYISPIQPVGREWNNGIGDVGLKKLRDIATCEEKKRDWEKIGDGVVVCKNQVVIMAMSVEQIESLVAELLHARSVIKFATPVLDPNEPAPEGPEVE